MTVGGIAALATVICFALLSDASLASDLSSSASRLAVPASGHQLDAIVAELDGERRATVAQLVEILRGKDPDATKIRACFLLGTLGDHSAEDALIENLDIVHRPYTPRKVSWRNALNRSPCATALLAYGPPIRDSVIQVIKNPQSPCARDQALWILYAIASSQTATDRAAQVQVVQILRRAEGSAKDIEKMRLEASVESLDSHPWYHTLCDRRVLEEQPEPAPHLAMGDLDRTAARLRVAKSPEELDGIVYGVEDQRQTMVESLLALLETQAAAPVKARACYLLGQFHTAADQRLADNVGLEWTGGTERYPCQEALARAWATGPAVVLSSLAEEGNEMKRQHLVDLMIGWYGGAGAATRLADAMQKRSGLPAARLKQAMLIAEAYAKQYGN